MPDNPIVGGVALRRPAIQSPNFITGSTGWSINADGTAEFNNLSIRGTFNGSDFIINDTGAFFYDGVPANGNLIASIASSGGTDSFGNVFNGPGMFVYASNNTGGLSAGALSLSNASDTFTMAADPTLDQLLLSALNGNAALYFLPALIQVTGAPLRVDEVLTYGAGGGGGGTTILDFTSSASWVAPAGVTSVNVEVWAAGGGGASSAGSGGGGGEYAAEHSNTCTPGNTYTITIGAQGAAGAGGASNDGGNGGDSSFSGTGATTVTAHGGGGGKTAGSPGGAAGTGSSNSTHHNGGTGGTSTGGSKGGGGGAGGGGSLAAGGNGFNASGNSPGSGGSGGVNGGSGGSGGGWGGSSPTTGGNANTPGGGAGGAGGWDGASNQKAGGHGSGGFIRLTYTVSGAPVSFAAMAGAAGSDASSNAFAAGFTGNIVAVQPGSNPAVVETWHSLGNYTSGTTTRGRYRLTAEGELEIDVNLTGTPTAGAGSFANTMPASYRPAVTKRGVITQGGTLGIITVATTGVVSATIGAGGSATADFAGRFDLT